MSYMIKLRERVLGHRLQMRAMVSENQFGLILGRSTMEAIHLLRRLIQNYKERKDLDMAFIDLEKI